VRLPVGFILEGNVEIGRVAKHVEEGPKGEPLGAVCLKAKIYPQPIDASLLHRRRSFAQVRCAKVALQKVVQVQGGQRKAGRSLASESPVSCHAVRSLTFNQANVRLHGAGPRAS